MKAFLWTYATVWSLLNVIMQLMFLLIPADGRLVPADIFSPAILVTALLLSFTLIGAWSVMKALVGVIRK